MTAHPETPRLGYIGLGNQGAPMAKRLLDWPGGLTVFDVRVEAMAPFVEGGATAAASVSDVAEADIISITVFDDAQVSSVITAPTTDWRRTPSPALLSRFTPPSPTRQQSIWPKSSSRRGSTSWMHRSAAARRRPPRVSWP